MNNKTLTPSVSGAVKAELARQDKTGNELTSLFGKSRDWVYARLRGDKAFTTEDLSKIADYLNISIDDLLESARFGRRITKEASA